MHPFALWILLGAALGAVAGLVFRGAAKSAILGGAVVGAIGAAAGGVLFHRGLTPPAMTAGSFLTATFGAVLLLAIAALATTGPSSRSR